MTTTEIRRYTAEQLGFYDGSKHAETAAFFASELIHTARLHGAINGEHVDHEKGANLIAQLVAEDFTDVGALDTVCRENFYYALTGELDRQIEEAEREAQLEEITSAPLAYGKPGWGVRRVAGLSFEACQADPTHATRAFSVCSECWNARPAFWVELGRQLFGPFDTIEAARGVLAAEERPAGDGPVFLGPDSSDEPTVDLPTYEGHYGVTAGKVNPGAAVALTFRDRNREPLFGYVRSVDRRNLIVGVSDVELGDQVVHAHDVETWAILPGRIGSRR